MKLAVIAALAMVASVSAASAQDVIITSDQDVVVREYVKKKPVASIDLPGVELNIGSTVPETVEVYRFEEVPDMDYSYTVVGGRTYLLEPGTRRVIKVYE